MTDIERCTLIKKLTSGDKSPSTIFSYVLNKFVICEIQHEQDYGLATRYREVRIDSNKIF